jgi:hypothetical protein
VIEDVELVVPWITVKLLGEGAERVKGKQAHKVRDKLVVWVTPPPTALIVMVVVPRVAVAVAVKETVTVQVGLHGLFVKVAVTPVGRVDVEKVTGWVMAAFRVAVIDEAGLVLPWTIVRLLGEGADRVKPGGNWQSNDNVVVWVTPPPTALMVTMVVAGQVAVAVAVNETVTVQFGLQGLLPKLAVIPAGRALVEKITGLVDPAVRVAVMDEVGLVEPWRIVKLLGEGAERLKLKGLQVQTVTLNVVVLVKPPPTPCTVKVVVPVAAVADAVRVTVAEHDGLQLAGVNALAVTPIGSAFAKLKVTGVVVPATSEAVTVSMPPAPPTAIVIVEGEAARLKSKGHGPWLLTVKVTERVSEPLVPATVTVSLPLKQPVATVRVDVRLLPEARTRLDGLREAVKPDVDVVADRATVPENPLTLPTITVVFVEVPGAMVADAGFTLRAKPGTGEPLRVIVFTIRSVRYVSNPIWPAGRLGVKTVVSWVPSK